MHDAKQRISNLEDTFSAARQKLQLQVLGEELVKLEKKMAEPDFWKDQEVARAVSQQAANLKKRLEPWQTLDSNVNELKELLALNDPSMDAEIKKMVTSAEHDMDGLTKQLRFNGPYDGHSVILGVYAGAGGTDAQDWAQMLLRMYTRWAEQHKLKLEMIEQSPGDEAGIKSATFKIMDGAFLYGRLKSEHGVHRLVRISPFNSGGTRETSFARVDVLPEIDRPEELELDESELKIDVYRAGGRGGQSVNTTDSAVRITHLPTGITAAIQNERSQLQNKQTAMVIIRSKLAQLKLEQHKENIADIKGPSKSAEWGNQIRSYVLHPYKQVKDLRSGYESSDVESVLDGNLDSIIDAYLDDTLSLPQNKH